MASDLPELHLVHCCPQFETFFDSILGAVVQNNADDLDSAIRLARPIGAARRRALLPASVPAPKFLRLDLVDRAASDSLAHHLKPRLVALCRVLLELLVCGVFVRLVAADEGRDRAVELRRQTRLVVDVAVNRPRRLETCPRDRLQLPLPGRHAGRSRASS